MPIDEHPSLMQDPAEPYTTTTQPTDEDEPAEAAPRKYYADGGPGGIDQEIIADLDEQGRLRVIQIIDHTKEAVRTLSNTAADIRKRWSDPQQRTEIITLLQARGIDFNELAIALRQPDADAFDLLCNVAFSAPIRTRRERVDQLHQNERAFFERYSPDARVVLDDLLEKYAEYGQTQFVVPDVLKVPPIANRGNVSEIICMFGGSNQLRKAVNELQQLLYAA